MERDAQVRSDVPVSRYDYEDGSLIVADLGLDAREATVEVLDDVVIVVLDGTENTSQFELEVPGAGVANTFITNGVLTIEVDEQ